MPELYVQVSYIYSVSFLPCILNDIWQIFFIGWRALFEYNSMERFIK